MVATLLTVAGCGSDGGNGGDSSRGSRADVIGSWQDEFCPTVQPELVAKRMSYARYWSEPSYLPMQQARTPNTFDCEAIVEIDVSEDSQVKSLIQIAVYNGKEPARTGVEAYYQSRLTDWLGYYEKLEGDEREKREKYDALQPFVDQKMNGSWKEGQAYAVRSSDAGPGSVFTAVRAADYALFITVEIPMDPEVAQAQRYAESYKSRGEKPPAELNDPESRRKLTFTDEEISEWVTSQYLPKVYQAIEKKLDETA